MFGLFGKNKKQKPADQPAAGQQVQQNLPDARTMEQQSRLVPIKFALIYLGYDLEIQLEPEENRQLIVVRLQTNTVGFSFNVDNKCLEVLTVASCDGQVMDSRVYYPIPTTATWEQYVSACKFFLDYYSFQFSSAAAQHFGALDIASQMQTPATVQGKEFAKIPDAACTETNGVTTVPAPKVTTERLAELYADIFGQGQVDGEQRVVFTTADGAEIKVEIEVENGQVDTFTTLSIYMPDSAKIFDITEGATDEQLRVMAEIALHGAPPAVA